MTATKNLAANLCLLRKRYGYTQEQVSAYLGISQSEYNKYESEVNEVPMDKLEQLATLYHVEEYDLLTAKEEDLQVDLAFAFRKKDKATDLKRIAPFQKIVQNYLEMSHELKD